MGLGIRMGSYGDSGSNQQQGASIQLAMHLLLIVKGADNRKASEGDESSAFEQASVETAYFGETSSTWLNNERS